ncbi:MAG: hypothetical protein RR033_02220 [Clostridia bacterium]
MKKREIEKMLIKSSDKFVPNVLDKVIASNITQPIESDVIALKRHNNPNRTKIFVTAVLATFVFLFGILTGGHFYFRADDSIVYIDINPSIELTLNRTGKVKSASAKNADAETLLAGQSLNGLNLEDAVERILELAVEQNYIDSASDNNEIMLSIYNKDLKKADRQMEKLNKRASRFFDSKGIKCKVDKETGNKKDNEKATQQGISPAKLKLIESIIAADSSYTIASLKDYSIKDLQKLLKELTK